MFLTSLNLMPIAIANSQLVQVVAGLYDASKRSSDPEIAQTVHSHVSTTLDLTKKISAAINPPNSDILKIATTNQRIVQETKELYDRLQHSSDPKFVKEAERYMVDVPDLTRNISAAIK